MTLCQSDTAGAHKLLCSAGCRQWLWLCPRCAAPSLLLKVHLHKPPPPPPLHLPYSIQYNTGIAQPKCIVVWVDQQCLGQIDLDAHYAWGMGELPINARGLFPMRNASSVACSISKALCHAQSGVLAQLGWLIACAAHRANCQADCLVAQGAIPRW